MKPEKSSHRAQRQRGDRGEQGILRRRMPPVAEARQIGDESGVREPLGPGFHRRRQDQNGVAAGGIGQQHIHAHTERLERAGNEQRASGPDPRDQPAADRRAHQHGHQRHRPIRQRDLRPVIAEVTVEGRQHHPGQRLAEPEQHDEGEDGVAPRRDRNSRNGSATDRAKRLAKETLAPSYRTKEAASAGSRAISVTIDRSRSAPP